MFHLISRLFNHDAEKQLAKNLAAQIVKSISPKLMSERRQVLSAKKISRLLEETYAIAKNYQINHRPGVIRRAVLANSFKWELKSSGYPDDFISVATEGLVVELGKKNGDRASKKSE